ncbi:MAG: hypothetical protein GTN62_08585 [Gemmatimonadales bacterium]|nr:hypothetical protein [Gemmatimonadales bacterium]NIN50154.1 hypothetical protein [Gemmatimonadales bacterium]NIP07618.1 hypothetical protein [Gemmatimonadales bacterium]NIR01770.1 hypothetical protein [Gemmatimonadales bacterium]NIS65673.1 hypothetical protein [Gemmatimonadales bacterium]
MSLARALPTLTVAVGLAGGAVWPAVANAQFVKPPAPAAYVLQGVTLVGPDGSRRSDVTIVVRRGFIEAIGNIDIPPDAELLEGDSLMVYPGLIDAEGKADVDFPEIEVDREELAFWAPPRDAQGFLPHRRVVDHLTSTGSDLESQRTKGVVAAAVHPDGPVMPGRGAVLLFRKGAETPADLVVDPELGPVMSFRGARGMYPGAYFGVVAFIRQSLEDARHDGLKLAAHQRDPRGLKAPSWDPDYAVLRDVLQGRTPVFFAADRAQDIRRVLGLATEYGFQPVIVGGDEAWKVADLLKERDVAVLVSLDFPKPERWKPEKEKEEEAEVPDTAAVEEPEQEEAPEPLDAAEQREKQRLEDIYSNAGRLAGAGVRFALTSGGGKADLREGARKAIEYGLGEDQALAAVTSAPAEILDVPYLSRVEEGMPATFVVVDGSLFDEESEIRYTFVEGELEKGKPKKEAKAAEEEPAVDVTGTWEVKIDAEGETIGGKMTLEQEGAEFIGTMELDVGTGRIQNGIVSGDEITFEILISEGGESITVEVTGTVEEDEASGSGSSPMGSFTWTAKRTGTPDRGE